MLPEGSSGPERQSSVGASKRRLFDDKPKCNYRSTGQVMQEWERILGVFFWYVSKVIDDALGQAHTDDFVLDFGW